MSDLYREHLVKRRTTTADTFKKAILISAVGACAIGGIFLNPLLLIAALGIGAAAYFIFPKFHVEYEYLLVNRNLDIDVIYSQKKRKKLKEFDLQLMEILAPANSHRLDSYNNNAKLQVLDYSSLNPDVVPYAMIIKDNQTMCKALLEFNQEMFSDLKRVMPNKVFSD